SDLWPRAVPLGLGSASSSASRSFSISSSWASESLKPSEPKNLMPLSATGLWDAEIITHASASISFVRYATLGVEMIPRRITSTPIESNPATSADSTISPEIRVSRPTSTVGLSSSFCPYSTYPPTLPDSPARSVVSSVFATPLTPSVPKYLPMSFSFFRCVVLFQSIFTYFYFCLQHCRLCFADLFGQFHFYVFRF